MDNEERKLTPAAEAALGRDTEVTAVQGDAGQAAVYYRKDLQERYAEFRIKQGHIDADINRLGQVLYQLQQTEWPDGELRSVPVNREQCHLLFSAINTFRGVRQQNMMAEAERQRAIESGEWNPGGAAGQPEQAPV